MKSFDEFKESREKMDPSARKMNEHQWEQAYEAYQRVRGRGQSVEESTAEDSRSLPTGRRRSNGGKQTTQLRHLVRGRTAYANERRTVDTLYWVAVAVLVLIFLAQLGTVFTTVMMVRDIGDAPTGGMQSVRVIQWGALFTACLGLVIQVLTFWLVRMLAHVLIDIPDIALFRMTAAEATKAE
ncbi:hypothetical protein [Coraliomargarita akajimensis]|uniref:Uncharacterized protein n=1 Tax=Coraliomargarita akajimensis (strain DSM 45221 / IAM 15411 / JCM 23193 / KCTC 12865 / 04OKA010-24) TaxID=583355 RepID=D5EIJ9_CORAD|nr:hypothetical protein [Coraliomargarita akajimensis]ADE54265.1 hypothetical protein Caka_1245 [Coraliomargarita akajimensis DSM 45221]